MRKPQVSRCSGEWVDPYTQREPLLAHVIHIQKTCPPWDP